VSADTSVSYRTICIDGVNIFCREAGPTNAPVLLLLHGVPTSSRMYQPMLESVLASKYRLVAPDYPGFGHFSWPDPKSFAYTFDHIAQVMQDFAGRLELARYAFFCMTTAAPLEFAWPWLTRKKSKRSLSKMRSRMRRDCLRFGAREETSGKIGPDMRRLCERVFFRWRARATGIWAHLLARRKSIPTLGLMNIIF